MAYRAAKRYRSSRPLARSSARAGRTRRRPVYRRRRTLTRTRRRKKYVVDNSVAHREYTKVNVKHGRPMRRNLRNLWKVTKAATEKYMFGAQDITEFGSTSGSVNLANTGVDGSTHTFNNIRLFSVTGNRNTVNGVGVANPLLWTSQTTSNNNGDYTWLPTHTMQVLHSPQSAAATVPWSASMLRWISLKLMIYNPLNMPGKYLIELIRFNDDDLHPTAPATEFRSAFMDSWVKPFTYNPVASTETLNQKYVTVLKRLVIHMDSKDVEQTTNTNYKEVNFFVRLNKICRYNWLQDDRFNIRSNDQPLNIGDNQTDVHPKQRLYVAMRCLSRRDSSFNFNVHPSIDFSYKVCHSRLD